MYGPKRPFLLRYGSRDTRRIDFPRVDGYSIDTPGFGASHIENLKITHVLSFVYTLTICLYMGLTYKLLLRLRVS